MRNILISATLAALPLAALPAAAQQIDQPTELGELFCQLTQGGNQFAPQYLLTHGLATEIELALKRNDEWAAAHPDEKPPLGDGIQFASYPDPPLVCRVIGVADAGDGKQVDIRYVITAANEGNWTDRLVLKQEDGLLRIDDVLYGAEKYELGLRKALTTVFQD